jgi:hypothetical protein
MFDYMVFMPGKILSCMVAGGGVKLLIKSKRRK